MGHLKEPHRQKMVLKFYCEIWKLLNFALKFFLFPFAFKFCLLTNKNRKVEVAKSNPIIENIPSSLSLSVG